MDKICFTFLNQIVCINVTLEDCSAGKENVKPVKWKKCHHGIFNYAVVRTSANHSKAA